MKIDLSNTTKLAFFQDLYRTARNQSEELYEKIEKYVKQYKGDDEIDGSNVKASY